jgi:ribosome biogenesis GTPase
MRELQLWARQGSVEDVFDDAAQLAAGCRFADCSHTGEPGCVVAAALAGG